MTDNTSYAGTLSSGELYSDTYAFNSISGSIQETSQKSFGDQLSFIEEEFEELQEGHADFDKVESLDACVDILVTVMGYMQKMQYTYGADVAKAMDLIAENNLSKYPPTKELAEQTVKMYADKGVETYYTYNEDYQVYVIRDKITGKVKKPVGFKPVDLSVCFPKLN